MPIEEVKMYKCPESGDLFTNKALATRNANKVKKQKEKLAKEVEINKKIKEERHFYSNYIRLNLSNVNDLKDMLILKAKEFYDVDITNLNIRVNFSERCSNSHNCPINGVTNWENRDNDKPTYYPGWIGRISANVVVPKNITNALSTFDRSANSVLFNTYSGLFKGFYTSSGCGGDSDGSYDMDIGFGFFLEDFPLLMEKYNLFIEEKKKIIYNNLLKQGVDSLAHEYANNHVDYTTKKTLATQMLEEANGIYDVLYKGFLVINEPEYEPIIEDYDNISQNFSEHGYYL